MGTPAHVTPAANSSLPTEPPSNGLNSSGPDGLPGWLTGAPIEKTPRLSKEGKALLFVQFEMVFPRVMEMICAGSTLANALRELPIPIDVGSFTTWMYKDARRKALYLESKEVRAESWTSEMIKHALGVDDSGTPIPSDIDRSKFIVDTYKWLVSRQARKEYGDTKTIEMNTTISITAALQQANERVIQATVIDDVDDDIELMDSQDYKQLSAPKSVPEDDED